MPAAPGVETPYRTGKHQSQSVRSDAPLRQGSYRCLAATGNNFARESFMDELAAAAGVDPLEFRLAHLDNPRLRAVLETAAQRFGWQERIKKKNPKLGIGLACGTEKGSYVAACAEVEIDPNGKNIAVRRVCQVFDCGAILNPANLLSQVQGAIIMGLGPALREEINFENGEVLNAILPPLPGPPLRRCARAGHPPAQPPGPRLSRGRRDAHHRHRAGHRQRRLPGHWPAPALDAHAARMMAGAVACHTVAIARAPICLVTKKKPLWFVAMVLSWTFCGLSAPYYLHRIPA